MDFDATVEAIEGLVGIEVAAIVSARSEESAPIATLGGVLASHHDVQPNALPQDLRGEAATTFRIGDHSGNVVTLWPSRFLRGDIDAAAEA